MGSLFEELQLWEVAARERVDDHEDQLARLTGRLKETQEYLERSRISRDIVEVVRDAPGPVRAKRIVPRIGLPADVGKIEGTRVALCASLGSVYSRVWEAGKLRWNRTLASGVVYAHHSAERRGERVFR